MSLGVLGTILLGIMVVISLGVNKEINPYLAGFIVTMLVIILLGAAAIAFLYMFASA